MTWKCIEYKTYATFDKYTNKLLQTLKNIASVTIYEHISVLLLENCIKTRMTTSISSEDNKLWINIQKNNEL